MKLSQAANLQQMIAVKRNCRLAALPLETLMILNVRKIAKKDCCQPWQQQLGWLHRRSSNNRAPLLRKPLKPSVGRGESAARPRANKDRPRPLTSTVAKRMATYGRKEKQTVPVPENELSSKAPETAMVASRETPSVTCC